MEPVPSSQVGAEAPGRRAAALLAAILAAGAYLRFGFLAARGWWYDEAWTVVAARTDWSQLLEQVRAHEGSPPLFFVLASGWARLFGTSEAGLRSLSAVLGVGTIWLAYAAARRLVSVRAGLVAAALAATNPMLVWLSLDARMYPLLVVLGGASFLCFAEALEEPRAPTLAGWAIASALVLWTHFFGVFLVAAESVWLLLRHRRNRRVWAGLLVVALAGAGLLPLAVAASAQEAWMASHRWSMRAASVLPEFLLGFQPPMPLLLAPAALATPVIATWLLLTRAAPDERRGATSAAIVGGVAVAVPALLALAPHLDLLMTRYLSAAVVPLLVVIAAGLGARRAGRLGMATVVLTCALGVAIDLGTARVSKFEHEDWRGALAAAGPATVPRAMVLTPSRGRHPLAVYRPEIRDAAGGRAVVSEIVVIALPPIFRTLGEASVPPRPPSPPSPDDAFRLTERVDGDSFTLLRYRAAGPVDVPAARLATLALAHEEPAVLLQPATPVAARP